MTSVTAGSSSTCLSPIWGVHPVAGDRPPSGTVDITFSCDDIARTVEELATRGVEFTHKIEDQENGLSIYFRVLGGFKVQLYEPK